MEKATSPDDHARDHELCGQRRSRDDAGEARAHLAVGSADRVVDRYVGAQPVAVRRQCTFRPVKNALGRGGGIRGVSSRKAYLSRETQSDPLLDVSRIHSGVAGATTVVAFGASVLERSPVA